ncbi:MULTISPECIES: DinB family protein [Alteribacter]|uniref:DinB family protein n=1 Tax=Alteribacter keqinensis TaxID=2483800 RepID=A0A3M7TZ50_9BACI|nr:MULTISPECIES: DinB family protein [Alteribacter]MBM7096249.1 DinB family protein [Alteribacter salitolerans]RNA70044.1 DinB family protein [Alteribacter keqinensis]
MEKKTLSQGPTRDSLYLLNGLIETREKLLEMIDQVDDSDLYFHSQELPTPAGYLLHLAQVELWWNRIGLQQSELSAEEKERFHFIEKQEIEAPTGLEKSWFLARLGEVRKMTREHYMTMSDMEFKRASLQVNLNGKDTLCSPEWVLYHLIDHESYHRGQIALLFRMLNGKREKWDHFNTPYLSI